MIEIQTATAADIPEVQELFKEYAAWTGVDLSFQNFSRELEELPGDYMEPRGVLLVARGEGRLAGCVAAHAWEEGVCEMKRLFVRDEFRGSGCGRALIDALITWARRAGYGRMLLDTLPVMDRAQALYARLGFVDVPPYRENPVKGARFLSLTL